MKGRGSASHSRLARAAISRAWARFWPKTQTVGMMRTKRLLPASSNTQPISSICLPTSTAKEPAAFCAERICAQKADLEGRVIEQNIERVEERPADLVAVFG